MIETIKLIEKQKVPISRIFVSIKNQNEDERRRKQIWVLKAWWSLIEVDTSWNLQNWEPSNKSGHLMKIILQVPESFVL